METKTVFSKRLRWILGISIALIMVLLPLLRYRWVYVETKRLRVVEPGKFYRSGLLTAKGLEQAIKQYGIKTVINLMDEDPDPTLRQAYFNGARVPERDVCERSGAKYMFLYVDLTSRFRVGLEQPKTIEQFLQVVHDPANLPVLLHCRAGLHRTGELTAVYRIEVDKWSPTRAWAELKDNGFGEFNCYTDNDYILQYVLRPAPAAPAPTATDHHPAEVSKCDPQHISKP